MRRTRQLCRAQQRSSTRSQTPACHRRRRSLTMRQRFPLLLTGAIRRQRPWSVEAQVPGVMAVGGDCWLRLGAPLSPHGDIGEEATAHKTGRRGASWRARGQRAAPQRTCRWGSEWDARSTWRRSALPAGLRTPPLCWRVGRVWRRGSWRGVMLSVPSRREGHAWRTVRWAPGAREPRTSRQPHGGQDHHRIVGAAVGLDPVWDQGALAGQKALPRTTPP